MRKELLVAFVMAALPLTAWAAKPANNAEPMSQDIQVVKVAPDASAITNDAITGISNAAETKDDEETTKALSKAVTKSLAYRVSSTATPEVNRMIREEMGQTVRQVASVYTPGADAFIDRKEGNGAPATITLDHMDLTYPVVTSVSPVVQKAMNDAIYGYVRDLKNDLETKNVSASDKENLVMYYDIKTDKNGILSLLIHTYSIMDHGTQGEYYVKGMTFNTTTGRQLSVSDFGGISVDGVNQAIESNPEIKGRFKENFPGFTSRPKEFYALADRSLVLIAQPSSVNKDEKNAVDIPVGLLRQDKPGKHKK